RPGQTASGPPPTVPKGEAACGKSTIMHTPGHLSGSQRPRSQWERGRGVCAFRQSGKISAQALKPAPPHHPTLSPEPSLITGDGGAREQEPCLAGVILRM